MPLGGIVRDRGGHRPRLRRAAGGGLAVGAEPPRDHTEKRAFDPPGEVHVSPGSEPERDDTGLPPVDVEIPDDARELDRDVQAYHRELRALRRNRRSRRVHGLLSRDSMVIPLLICCLVFALISGTLLTLFTATSIDQGLPGQGSAAGSLPGPVGHSAPAAVASDNVDIGGQEHPLSTLGPAVLLQVPADCRACAGAVRQVATLDFGAGVGTYLLYSGSGSAATSKLARQLGHGVVTAQDVTGGLTRRTAGLTAFIVTARGMVQYFQHLDRARNLSDLLQLGNLT
jgi:hypothetical protein